MQESTIGHSFPSCPHHSRRTCHQSTSQLQPPTAPTLRHRWRPQAPWATTLASSLTPLALRHRCHHMSLQWPRCLPLSHWQPHQTWQPHRIWQASQNPQQALKRHQLQLQPLWVNSPTFLPKQKLLRGNLSKELSSPTRKTKHQKLSEARKARRAALPNPARRIRTRACSCRNAATKACSFEASEEEHYRLWVNALLGLAGHQAGALEGA
mmetsp:Transcript_12341/g.28970  ORF Transcript_12341/g.28970 Transcript_12341/m.28970 type:complete len:210 (-) Transcript_12341:184-813(-)